MRRSQRVRAPRFRIAPSGKATLAGVSNRTFSWILSIAANDTMRRLRKYEKRLASGVNDPQMIVWVQQLRELLWAIQQFDQSRLEALDADRKRGSRPPQPLTEALQRVQLKARLLANQHERQMINRIAEDALAAQAELEAGDAQ